MKNGRYFNFWDICNRNLWDTGYLVKKLQRYGILRPPLMGPHLCHNGKTKLRGKLQEKLPSVTVPYISVLFYYLLLFYFFQLDIDECASGSHNCVSGTATSYKTVGSHNCYCEQGYYGDGQTSRTPNGKCKIWLHDGFG